MNDYIKGLITGYERVIQLIEQIDPQKIDPFLDVVDAHVKAWLKGYQLFAAIPEQQENSQETSKEPVIETGVPTEGTVTPESSEENTIGENVINLDFTKRPKEKK